MRRLIYIALAIVIAGIGYKLRLEKFYFFPPIGDTYDEYKAPFNGLSLLNDGVPRSWSWFSQYTEESMENVRGTKYRLVTPWFDEPPLFSLMAGAYAKYKGINSIHDVDAGVFRYPMLKVAVINCLALFLILYLLGRPLVGLLAEALYATTPTIVIASRLPISDNMVASFALLSILGLVVYYKYRHRAVLVLLGIVSASALLLKTPGVFVPVAIIFLLAKAKLYKPAIFVTICLLVSMSIWLWYGYYYDWNTFMQIASVSSGRELYQPGNLISLFLVYRIGESAAAVDGWLIWGWISVCLISFLPILQNQKTPAYAKFIIPSMVGSYLVFFSIMSGHNKGWYRFPFFPFLSWAAAETIIGLIREPKILPSLFFLGVPFASSYMFGNGGHKFSPSQIRGYQYFAVFLTAPFMLNEIFNRPVVKKVSQFILICAVLSALYFNIQTILVYQDRFWYQ